MDDIKTPLNNVTPISDKLNHPAGHETPTTPESSTQDTRSTSTNIDSQFTKVAVDLQNIHSESQNATIRESLRLVCDAIGVDAAGLVLLKPGSDIIE